MIHSFIESWSLFGDTYLTAWALAVMLAVVGIPVVARDQIFLGAAVTQTALLGVAVGYLVANSEVVFHSSWANKTVIISLFSVGFAVATTVFTMCLCQDRHTPESLTGWLFLAATGLTYVVLAKSPFGLKGVSERVSSSLIGASRADSIMFSILAVAVCIAARQFFRPLMLVTFDRHMAIACGLTVRRIELIMALAIGLILGLALRASGMLYAFGYLVLPALFARQLCRNMRTVFIVAPIAALLIAVAAFAIGNHWDLPQAPLAVSLMAVALLPAAMVKRQS